MEYLEDNTDAGQLENELYKFRCIKDDRGPYNLSTLEVGTTYLLNGKLGR